MSEKQDGDGNPPQVPLDTSDEELMRLYREHGNEKAFEALYGRHAGRVYSYISSRIPRRQEADEVFQSVFAKFHKSRTQYDPQYAVLQWIYVIARTAIVDHYRAGGRSPAISGDTSLEQIADQVAAPLLDQEPVAEPGAGLTMLQKLSERDQKVVKWRVLDELSYLEISRRIGQSETSVRQILSRALKKLRFALETKGTTP